VSVVSTNAITSPSPGRGRITRAYHWVVLAILWLTLLVSYFDRVAIAAALPFLSLELHLRPSTAGLVAGALLLTYTLVQVPAGYLADRFGQRRIIAAAIAWWRWVFYLTAVPGLLCVLLVLRFLWDSPPSRDLTAPRPAALSDTLADVAGTPGGPEHGRSRWWVPHVWLTFGAFLFFGFVLYGLMSWLPTYLVSYRGLDLTRAGVFATSPYLAGTVGMLAGAWLCQRRFQHVRRRFVAGTYLATAVCIGATVLAPTVTMAGLCLTASGLFLYSGLGPFWSVPMDVVRPGEVGTWLGFINMGTQISGFLGPVLIGWLVQLSGSFTPALLAMVGSLVLAAGCLTAIRAGEAPTGVSA
jgi:sugar phosphate permease